MEGFVEALRHLCKEHGVYLSGRMRLVKGSGEIEDAHLTVNETHDCGNGITDRTGPFLVAEIDYVRPPQEDFVYGQAPGVAGDYTAYECPVTGKMIEGRAEHRENLKRTGCRLLEPGESRDFAKRHKEEKRENTRKLVDSIYDSMAGEL